MTNSKTVGASGADYTTIEAALDWLVANHNYGTDGKATITITDAATYTLGNSDYPYDVNLPGTPTSSAYLEITSDATDPFSGPTLECTHTTGNGTLKLWDSYTYIHNLKFLVSSSTTSLEAIRAAIDNISNLLISRCVFINTGGGSDQDAIYSGSISSSGSIDNCVFVNFPRGAVHLQIFNASSDTQSWNVDHCSCAISQSSSESEGGFIGLRTSHSTNTYNVAAYNNAAYHHTDDAGSADCFNESASSSTVNWSGSNNIVDDTSAEAKFTSSYDSVTFTETEPSSGENAWLTEIDTATYVNIDLEIAGQNSFTVTQNGTDRTGSEPDARQDFSTDILGNTRGATPCIGAFEFSATSGQTLSPGGIASGEAFGSATISTGAVTVSPTGIVSSEAFGSATIAPGSVAVAPSGIASDEAFGTSEIVPGATQILANGIASLETFGSTTIAAGQVLVHPSAIGSAEAFGTAIVTTDAAIILPSGISSAEAFGTATLAPGAVSVQPSAIDSSESFGASTVVPGQVDITPAGIASGELFGTTAVVAGTVVIEPSGVVSAEAFGTVGILTQGVVAPAGIASAEGFGTLTVSGGSVTLLPSGIASAEAFGTLTVQPGTIIVLPASIDSVEAFGGATMITGAVVIAPNGITSAEGFGAAELLRLLTILEPEGIVSAEAFGSVVIVGGVETLGELVASLQIRPGLSGILGMAAALSAEKVEIMKNG